MASPTNPPHEQTCAFVDALLAGIEPGYYANLWTLQDKRSHWFPAEDTDAIAQAITDLGDREMDVYLQVSFAAAMPPAPVRHRERIKAADSAGLYGLWADVDIKHPDAHANWNYPATEDEALQLIRSTGVEPTMIVHSGHGLQAWWLWQEPMVFESEADRAAAASLAQRWNATLRARAAEKGWTVDSVFDLARVMRPPGPMNRKGTPVPVQLIAFGGTRYHPDDLEAHCLDPTFLADRGLTPARSYVPDAIEVTENAQPHFEKFEALRANTELFDATWDRKRKDFLDQSGSVYDLSLASQAAAASWSDQEIADLLIAFRRRHKLDLAKVLTRPDYLKRTIAKARDGQVKEAAADEVDEVEAQLAEAKATDDPDAVRTARQSVLNVLGAMLGIEILHWWRYDSDPPTFRLETPTHTISLGGSEGVLRQEKFRQAVWESTGHQVERFKPGRWDEMTRLVPQVWEHVDVGFEATERGEVHGWLAGFLDQHPAVDTEAEALEQESPFVGEDKRVRIFPAPFKRYLHYAHQERISSKAMAAKLRAFGCTPGMVRAKKPDGAPTTKQVWVLPQDWKA